MEYCLRRGIQAVEIQPIETNRMMGVTVEVVQPFDECQHIHVPPHKRWKTFKVPKRIQSREIVSGILNKTIHTISIWPVGFHGDGLKSLMLYQPLGDPSSLPIELVCSMACFTNKNDTCTAGPLEEISVFRLPKIQGSSRSRDRGNRRNINHGIHREPLLGHLRKNRRLEL